MRLIYPAALFIGALISAAMSMLLASCDSQQSIPPAPVVPVTPVKNVIYGEDIGSVAVVCIDGAQYLATVTALAPRYIIDAEGDPYVGTCVNR
jgi:hypothetical protein